MRLVFLCCVCVHYSCVSHCFTKSQVNLKQCALIWFLFACEEENEERVFWVVW